MPAKSLGPKPTASIAGDDIAAEAALADLITAGGCPPIDAGSFARAHELEAVGFLRLTLAAETISWTGGFGVVPVSHGARSRPPSVLLLLGRCDRVAGEQLGADQLGHVL